MGWDFIKWDIDVDLARCETLFVKVGHKEQLDFC